MLVGNLEYDEGISNSFVVEVYCEKEKRREKRGESIERI